MSSSKHILRIALPVLALIIGLFLGDLLSSGDGDAVEISKRTIFSQREEDGVLDMPLAQVTLRSDDRREAVEEVLPAGSQPIEASAVANGDHFQLDVEVLYEGSFAPAMGYKVAVVAEYGASGEEALRIEDLTTLDGVASFQIPSHARTLVIDTVFETSRQRVGRRVERNLVGEDLSLQVLIPMPFRVAVQLQPSERLSDLKPSELYVAWDGMQEHGLPKQGLGVGNPDSNFLAAQIVHGYSAIESFKVTIGKGDHVIATAVYPRDEVTSDPSPVLRLDFGSVALQVRDAAGQPISSAKVYGVAHSADRSQGYRADALTDSEGLVRLFVPLGAVSVCVGKDGHMGFVGEFDADGDLHQVVLEEMDGQATVTIEVCDEDGTPVPDAMVTMTPEAEIPTIAMASFVQAYTDADGIAELPIVYDGPCFVQAVHRQRGSTSRGQFEVYDGAHAILYIEEIFELKLNLFVDGSKWERNGEALYWHVDDLDLERSWTGSFMAGRTNLEELPTGRLGVHLLAPEHDLYSVQRLRVQETGEFEVDVPMERGRKLLGVLPQDVLEQGPTKVTAQWNGDGGIVATWFKANVRPDGSFSLFIPNRDDVRILALRDGQELANLACGDIVQMRR